MTQAETDRRLCNLCQLLLHHVFPFAFALREMQKSRNERTISSSTIAVRKSAEYTWSHKDCHNSVIFHIICDLFLAKVDQNIAGCANEEIAQGKKREHVRKIDFHFFNNNL
jgi:hypothetical protein